MRLVRLVWITLVLLLVSCAGQAVGKLPPTTMPTPAPRVQFYEFYSPL